MGCGAVSSRLQRLTLTLRGLELWLRARRPRILLAVGFCQVLLPFAAAGAALPLPSLLIGSFLDVPLASLVPILIVAMLQISLSSDQIDAQLCPVVRVHWLDVGLIVAVAAAGSVGSLLAAWQLSLMQPIEWARNAFAFLGIGCCTRALTGTSSMAIGPLVFGMMSVLLGTSADRTVALWALPVQPAHSKLAIGASAALLVIGLALSLALPRHRPRRR